MGIKASSKQQPLVGLREVIRFTIVVALVAVPISALLGAGSIIVLESHTGVRFLGLFATWWVGDFLGALLVTPFLLSWKYPPEIKWSRFKLIESTAIIGLSSFFIFYAFSLGAANVQPMLIGQFIIFPLIIYCAYRFGARGLYSLLLIFSFIAIYTTVSGKGPIYLVNEDFRRIWLAGYLALICFSGLFLFAAIAESIKGAEDAIEYRERYRALIEGFPDLAFVLDEKGKYIEIIAGDEMLLVSSANDLKGKTIFDVMPKENADEVYSVILKTLEKGPQFITYELSVAAGVRNFEGRTSRIYSESRRKALVVLVSRDVTDKIKSQERERELEARLHQTHKMEVVSQMAGGVAHDLNNILSGVVAYPDYIKMQLDPKSPLIEIVDRVKDAGTKASEIALDLLTLSRQSSREPEVIELNAIIKEFFGGSVLETLKRKYPYVKISHDLATDLPPMKGSAIHMTKILMNLVINAFESIGNEGKVVIETYKTTDGKVGFSIKDNGKGIPEKDLKRVFEPFYSKKDVSSSGTGLGLTVVWGIVQDHGGKIDAESTVNMGTSFKIVFPSTVEKIPHTELQKQNMVIRQSDFTAVSFVSKEQKRYLVVDDQEDQRLLARTILEKMGHTVDVAISGEAAVQEVKKVNYNLVLLDMRMGDGWDGLVTYKRIIKVNPRQKVVIVSGRSGKERMDQALSLGVLHWLKKPYTVASLSEIVTKYS